MADFVLGTSTLARTSYVTKAAPLLGEFADLQFQLSNSGSGQDLEVHYVEFHFTIAGTEEDR